MKKIFKWVIKLFLLSLLVHSLAIGQTLDSRSKQARYKYSEIPNSTAASMKNPLNTDIDQGLDPDMAFVGNIAIDIPIVRCDQVDERNIHPKVGQDKTGCPGSKPSAAG